MGFEKDRFKAASIHFVLSLLVAASAALLMFGLWYPGPYLEISGGRELFCILVAVDLVLGPLITLVIFNRAKPRSMLLVDFTVIGILQIAALAYGLWTMSMARPVHLVFEYDRFRVVHALEVPEAELRDASSDFKKLPLTGPTVVALRPLRNGDEQFQLTLEALNGLSLSARPRLWVPYEEARTDVLKIARPMTDLRERFASSAQMIDLAVAGTGHPIEDLAYIPMIGHKSFWTVLLDRQSAQVLAYLPVDSF